MKTNLFEFINDNPILGLFYGMYIVFTKTKPCHYPYGGHSFESSDISALRSMGTKKISVQEMCGR